MSNLITVVTGASKGLGKHIAKLAIAEGHTVIVNARSESPLQELKSLAPDRVEIVTGDLSKTEVRQALVAKVSEFNKLDYLVNNAGKGPIGVFDEETEEDTISTITLNVTALIDLTRRLLPHVKAAPRGRVMNIASIAGIIDFPFASTYIATKHAVVGFSKALNTELAMTNATCTAYCPAGIDTEFFDESMTVDAVKTISKTLQPVEKVAKGIWKNRDDSNHIVYPTFSPRAQVCMAKTFEFALRPFMRLYVKKRGLDTVRALTK